MLLKHMRSLGQAAYVNEEERSQRPPSWKTYYCAHNALMSYRYLLRNSQF